MTATRRLALRRGRLGLDDMARHVPVPFEVPDDVAALRIAFDHRPQHPGLGDIPHQLSISVIGPAGVRGTRHCNPDQSVLLSEERASPGYLPGRPEPGSWRVEIDTHRILPPGRIDWTVTVDAVSPPDPVRVSVPSPAPDRGPGWYRGDLHRHTEHSDASWSAAEMVSDARRRGYDFAALTDHNTVSALAEARDAAGADLLILPGIELTTFHGHALALGSGRMWDWRIRDGQSMSARVAEIHAAGDLVVIAHPMAIGHPFCTGCTWAWADMMPGPARLVEVWNGPWRSDMPKNTLGLDLFRSWLNAGHRLVATASSDDHGTFPPGTRPGHMLVHAERFTVRGLIDGLAAGHAVLTSGPVLTVTGEGPGGVPVLPGDRIAAPDDLEIAWSDGPRAGRLEIVGGRVGAATVVRLAARTVGPGGVYHLSAHAIQGVDWLVVELRERDGTLAALANPIFIGSAAQPPTHRSGCL